MSRECLRIREKSIRYIATGKKVFACVMDLPHATTLLSDRGRMTAFSNL